MKEECQTAQKSWISDDNMLLFEFTLLRYEPERASIVNYKISRIVRDGPAPFLEGCIGEKTEHFEHTFSDGYKVRGTLNTVIFDNTQKEIGVCGNIFYSHPAFHFEGMMVAFAGPDSWPPLPPIPNPLRPFPDEPAGEAEILHGESDLFPYIYLHTWPATPDRAVERNFITYPVAYAQPGSLYETLKQLKAAHIGDTRTEMLKACVDFIAGSTFYETLENIPLPWRLLPRLYDYLYREEKYDRRILPEEIYLFLQMESAVLMEWIASQEFKEVMDRVWQNYFALLILQGYADTLAREIIKLIMAANILEKLLLLYEPEEPGTKLLYELIHASILLPQAVFPLPAAGVLPAAGALPAVGVPPGRGVVAAGTAAPAGGTPFPVALPAPEAAGGTIRALAIGLLQMVRQRLLRYEPGEIARIDNVLKGERKRITWRSLDRKQEAEENRTDRTNTITESGAEDTADLLTETKRTVADVQTLTQYNNFETTYGPPCNATLNGSWSSEIIPKAGSPETTDVTDFAKKILHQTSNRIKETVHRYRMHSSLSEIERTSCSIFDNSNGSANYRGIYRWLNKVYQARVVRYGYRLILQIKIEHPAAAYIRSEKTLQGEVLNKPQDPVAAGVRDFTAISRENFIGLCVAYEVDQTPLPPEEKKIVSIALQNDENRQTVIIPPGYQAVRAHLAYSFAVGATQLVLNGAIGRSAFSYNGQQGNEEKIPLHGEDSTLQVSVISGNAPAGLPYTPDDFVLNVEVECAPADKLFAAWQLDIYQRIIAGYQRQKNAYYAYMDNQKNAAEEGNPAVYRQIERTELIKCCEKILLDAGIAKTGNGQDNSWPAPAGINQPEYSSFFREVFEWKEMSYVFDGEGNNAVFPTGPGRQQDRDTLRGFLQASSAGVLLPVNPTANFRVIYFLSTGMIWSSDYRFVPVIKTDLPVANELKKFREEPKMAESPCWEIVIPGSMQIIQDDEGLPLL